MILPQPPQNAIDVRNAEAEGIAEELAGQRNLVAIILCQPHRLQPDEQLKK